jgi:hypothetical protein
MGEGAWLPKEKARTARATQPVKHKTTAANKTPVGKNTVPSAGNPHLPPVRKTITTDTADKPPLLSISRGGVLGNGLNSVRKRERIIDCPLSTYRALRRQRLRIID